MTRRYLKGLGTIGFVTVLAASTAMAADNNFTTHHSLAHTHQKSHVRNMPAEKKIEIRQFLDYEAREPCQNYQPVPKGFVRGDDCKIYPEGKLKVMKVHTKKDTMRINNVLSDYEVNFAFDSARIEPAAGNTLDRVANEIKRYNPREVTVAGHTDTAGPSSYNTDLSRQRAEAVSQALTDRGVQNRVLDEEAYGESRPAVNTQDGVPLRENRRVVVEFRR